MKVIINKTGLLFLLAIATCFGCKDDDTEYFEEVKSFNGDVVITSQEELDDFASDGYDIITGSLEVRGDVESLSNLLDLNEIVGDLFIVDAALNLTTLEGLDNLNRVTGFILIYNQSIIDFCALQPLFTSGEYNGNSVDISNNIFNPSVIDISQGNCFQ